jgi:flavodoxin
MSQILIAYYSMGGNTRRLAEEIHAATGADMDEISEPAPRRGFKGVMRALFDATLARKPSILATEHNPADYDLLIIGGPIWARRMAAPVRTFAERYGTKAKQVAFFCTEGGKGAETGFTDLERLSQHHAVATLTVDAAHLDPAAHRSDLGHFLAGVRRNGASKSNGVVNRPNVEARH